VKRSRILVAVALAALVATVSIGWPGPRICRNDVAAWASLRSIAAAQAKFKSDKRIDRDRDGVGEFGYIAELAGCAPMPGSGELVEPYLSGAFKYLQPDGTIRRSGYRFRMFLPGPGGKGEGEGSTNVDPALAEQRWCAYAWPADHGNTGSLTLFIDQEGTILCTDDARYSGDRGPEPGAAYGSGGLASITGQARADAKAQDGNIWRPFR
jgi:hypothetical protein